MAACLCDLTVVVDVVVFFALVCAHGISIQMRYIWCAPVVTSSERIVRINVRVYVYASMQPKHVHVRIFKLYGRIQQANIIISSRLLLVAVAVAMLWL